MLLGFDLPTRGALASPETITRLAIEGEAMGFDYLTLSDHIVIPRDIEARYPYSTTGEFPSGGRTDWYEQLTSAAFVAAKTTRLRMVTSVMVVPHRPAVLTAKVLATIDLLSNGRLTVGVGAGWMKEEFEAVGTPPFAERGAVTKGSIEFSGRRVDFRFAGAVSNSDWKSHTPVRSSGVILCKLCAKLLRVCVFLSKSWCA
jgi:alkanesulfonate monooxygenase SsuD/methylene tetrahydromethanopterin reductase-like flavin-dependent oxidoreductase (luciferase family)